MSATIPRDDRAWPRGAVTISVLLAAVAAAFGVGVTVAAAGRGPVPAAVAGSLFVAVAAAEVAVYLTAIRPWLRGGPMPRSLVLGQVLGLVAAALAFLVDLRFGGAALAGLFAGMMAGNVAAVRVAHRNRTEVDAAEAEQEAARARVSVRRPLGGPVAEPVGRVLRESVATDTRLALAWLVAGGLAAAGGAALGAPVSVLVPVLVLAAVGLLWVLRRLWAGWLALREFSSGVTPPVRAYVALVHEPNPRLIRPLLGVWSTAPEVHGGRLPRPERVYRSDADHLRLECTKDSLVVHEAWLGAGPRPGSKPRWVSADAGLALPHRRALLGRWYLSSLIGGARPGPAVPLTQPPPRPDAVEAVGDGPGWKGLPRAVAVRAAGLTVAALALSVITGLADGPS